MHSVINRVLSINRVLKTLRAWRRNQRSLGTYAGPPETWQLTGVSISVKDSLLRKCESAPDPCESRLSSVGKYNLGGAL